MKRKDRYIHNCKSGFKEVDFTMEFILSIACDFLDIVLDILLNPVFDRFGALVSKFTKK